MLSRIELLAVPCPWCRASPGTGCVAVGSGRAIIDHKRTRWMRDEHGVINGADGKPLLVGTTVGHGPDRPLSEGKMHEARTRAAVLRWADLA